MYVYLLCLRRQPSAPWGSVRRILIHTGSKVPTVPTVPTVPQYSDIVLLLTNTTRNVHKASGTNPGRSWM